MARFATPHKPFPIPRQNSASPANNFMRLRPQFVDFKRLRKTLQVDAVNAAEAEAAAECCLSAALARISIP